MTAWFVGGFLALFYLDRISRDPQDSFRLACLTVRGRVSMGPLITPFCPYCFYLYTTPIPTTFWGQFHNCLECRRLYWVPNQRQAYWIVKIRQWSYRLFLGLVVLFAIRTILSAFGLAPVY